MIQKIDDLKGKRIKITYVTTPTSITADTGIYLALDNDYLILQTDEYITIDNEKIPKIKLISKRFGFRIEVLN